MLVTDLMLGGLEHHGRGHTKIYILHFYSKDPICSSDFEVTHAYGAAGAEFGRNLGAEQHGHDW